MCGEGYHRTVPGKRDRRGSGIRRQALAEQLEELYREYNHRDFVHPDPLEFLYAYPDIRDREIVGLVASALAYGRVATILLNTRIVLDVLGPHPAQRLAGAGRKGLQEELAGFKHRFTTGLQMAGLLWGIRAALAAYGSLNDCFLAGMPEDRSMTVALHEFGSALGDLGSFPCDFLLPTPEKGSACKRLNLYMRWMVRDDEVDPGGWHGVSAADLIVPLDTHMFRTGHAFGFTRRRQADLRAALEVTDGFRRIVPDDPVRYDFSLTRLGIRAEAGLDGFLRRIDKPQS